MKILDTGLTLLFQGNDAAGQPLVGSGVAHGRIASIHYAGILLTTYGVTRITNDPPTPAAPPPSAGVRICGQVYEQDRGVVESQRPEQLTEELSAELHVKNVDTYSVAYRVWLLELAKELEPAP